MKTFLDGLVEKYRTPAFIAGDPLSFPHRYRNDPANVELVAFLAALFSYGRRDLILQTVGNILDRVDGNPAGFIERYTPAKGKKVFRGFIYRFNRPDDLVFLFGRLQQVYGEYGSLEGFFMADDQALNIRERITSFIERFLQPAPPVLRGRYGMKFLFATPANGGACKRFNMFLRWMVRDDGIDLGLWRKSLSPGELIVPMDTHVAQVGRALKLIKRNANDWQCAEELTAVFRRYCPADPVVYDFALFGLGVSESRPVWEEMAAATRRGFLGQPHRL